MTTWIEDQREYLLNENDFVGESIEIRFADKTVKFKFFYDDGGSSDWNIVDKKEFLNFVLWAQGAIHPAIRSHRFETLN